MRNVTKKGGARGGRAAAGLLALALLLAGAGTASADACSSCPAPSEDDIRAAEPGFELAWRSGFLGLRSRDYLETDAGECAYALAGPPQISIGKSWLVLRGSGSVWNCPWGRSDDEIAYEIDAGDSSGWSLDASLDASLKQKLLQLLLDVDFSMAESSSVREVRRVTKRLEAAYGHVLDWSGYFELADVVCDLDVNVTRRWSWWTKNSGTGATVHQQGVVWMECGNEAAQLTRRASIGYSIRVLDSSCDAPDAPPIDRGTFPRHRPPVVTPSDDPPVPAHDEGGDDGGDEPPSEPLDPEPRSGPQEPRSGEDADEPRDGGEPREAPTRAEPEEADEPPPATPPAAPGAAPAPVGSTPDDSEDLGEAPTGGLPCEPEGFGGPTPPGCATPEIEPAPSSPTAGVLR